MDWNGSRLWVSGEDGHCEKVCLLVIPRGRDGHLSVASIMDFPWEKAASTTQSAWRDATDEAMDGRANGTTKGQIQ